MLLLLGPLGPLLGPLRLSSTTPHTQKHHRHQQTLLWKDSSKSLCQCLQRHHPVGRSLPVWLAREQQHCCGLALLAPLL
jgi:hypothetical protein